MFFWDNFFSILLDPVNGIVIAEDLAGRGRNCQQSRRKLPRVPPPIRTLTRPRNDGLYISFLLGCSIPDRIIGRKKAQKMTSDWRNPQVHKFSGCCAADSQANKDQNQLDVIIWKLLN